MMGGWSFMVHGIASTVSLNRPRSPAMSVDRSAISVANSETGQSDSAVHCLLGRR
jgi:hypothetical protein